ncbi:MAG TPA: nicotinate phosphoribosyltransferase, partial [Actinotalea sp.]|nr:nicotinate phosphoribosyltransferase [Actinotalea sp.]
GATGTRIVVSSDLDEYAIAALAEAPVDSYGVGTSVVTGSGAPTCGMVYKLVAREARDGTLVPVAKASTRKASPGGRRAAARRLGPDGRALEEVLVTGPDEAVSTWSPAEQGLRPLHVPLVVHGAVDTRWTGSTGVQRAAARHEESRRELPRSARRLSAGEPAVPTVTLALA